MQIFLKNWYDAFLKEASRSKQLRIVSPFVKDSVVQKLQTVVDFNQVELITRFSLADFACKVSSVDALKLLADNGSKVYGIRNLHSKIYIFDERSVIISSANLTTGGMINNYECGILVDDPTVIKQVIRHFNHLKRLGGDPLETTTCDEWNSKLDDLEVTNTVLPSLPDYGKSEIPIDNTVNYYVKFFGTGDNRVPLSFSVRDIIDSSLCHYACGFPRNKKPRQINTGDIVFFARTSYYPTDIVVFGRAEAMSYVEGRDEATTAEIKERDWKEDWPIYLRITNPVFIDGRLSDGISLYEMINELDYQSFPSTKSRYENGERDIRPKRSLSQQPYVRLSDVGADWMESRFQDSLTRVGQIPMEFIQSLPIPKGSTLPNGNKRLPW